MFDEEVQRMMAAAEEAKSLQNEHAFTELAKLLAMFHAALIGQNFTEVAAERLTSDYFCAVIDVWTRSDEDE